MKTIYKYEIPWNSEDPNGFTLPVKFAARPRHLQEQLGKLYMWAEVETESMDTEWTFFVVGTGHEIAEPHDSEYVGTWTPSAIIPTGALVLHLYRLT